jgi:single-stranded-DNA-specific exonuclease
LNNGIFLGVESSATRRAWRSRLDERGSARALAIAQRHDLPELLARILAGRNVEVDAVEAFLDPTIKRTMPDPNVLTAMPEAAARVADAIVRGRGSLSSATTTLTARPRPHCWRAFCATPASIP